MVVLTEEREEERERALTIAVIPVAAAL